MGDVRNQQNAIWFIIFHISKLSTHIFKTRNFTILYMQAKQTTAKYTNQDIRRPIKGKITKRQFEFCFAMVEHNCVYVNLQAYQADAQFAQSKRETLLRSAINVHQCSVDASCAISLNKCIGAEDCFGLTCTRSKQIPTVCGDMLR